MTFGAESRPNGYSGSGNALPWRCRQNAAGLRRPLAARVRCLRGADARALLFRACVAPRQAQQISEAELVFAACSRQNLAPIDDSGTSALTVAIGAKRTQQTILEHRDL